MNGRFMTIAAYLAAMAGILLHVYLTIFHTMGGSPYFYIVPSMHAIPYLVCIYLLRSKKKPVMPLFAAILLFVTDLYMFQDYLSSDQKYRYMFIEMMQIMIKTLVILPIGWFMGKMFCKLMGRFAE